MATFDDRPVYEHDCDECLFLGHYGGADLYYCSQSGSPTVLARFSSDPPNYTSGLAFAQTNVYLCEAKRRASRKGLLA
jgi:hypothetical protein